MFNVFQAHKLGVFILRNRRAGLRAQPQPMVTDDHGNLVAFDGEQFNVSAYGWRDQH